MPEEFFFSQETKTKVQVLMEVLLDSPQCTVILNNGDLRELLGYFPAALGNHTVIEYCDLDPSLVWHQHVVCFDDQETISEVFVVGKPETLTIIS